VRASQAVYRINKLRVINTERGFESLPLRQFLQTQSLATQRSSECFTGIVLSSVPLVSHPTGRDLSACLNERNRLISSFAEISVQIRRFINSLYVGTGITDPKAKCDFNFALAFFPIVMGDSEIPLSFFPPGGFDVECVVAFWNWVKREHALRVRFRTEEHGVVLACQRDFRIPQLFTYDIGHPTTDGSNRSTFVILDAGVGE
jgi:hypothetical protein